MYPSNLRAAPQRAPLKRASLKRALIQRLAAAALIVSACLSTSAYGLTQSLQEWADKLGIDTDVEYQATRVITTKDGNFEYQERRAPQKMLMHMSMEGMKGMKGAKGAQGARGAEGMNVILLMREDLGKSYTLMPSMGMYREMKMDKANQQAGGVDGLTDVSKVGRETVNGYDCTKFKAKITSKDGKGDGFIWVSDSGVPIKMDMVYSTRRNRGHHMVMELKDLKITPQDPALFELPADLKPFGLRGLGKLFQR